MLSSFIIKTYRHCRQLCFCQQSNLAQDASTANLLGTGFLLETSHSSRRRATGIQVILVNYLYMYPLFQLC